ncbi:MAG TPA: hypothetical protein VFF84_02225 [Sphingobium sp.]|nr:hypothetical protein [Sphingobium sp.]
MTVISYRLVGSFSVDGADRGFLCPVFVDAEGRWFIQEMDEVSSRIAAFVEIPKSVILDDSTVPHIEIGLGALGIFSISGHGDGPSFGNLEDLKDRLKRISTHCDPGLRLQIGDLLGDQNILRTGALEFAHSISRSDPKAADRFLHDAIAPQLIWKWLLQNIAPSAHRSELIAYRHDVFMSVNAGHTKILPDELWEQVSKLVTISREFLALSLKEMFGPLGAGNSFARRSELMRERQMKLAELENLQAEMEQATQRIETHRYGIGSVYRYSGNPPEGSGAYEAAQLRIKSAQELLAAEERAYSKGKGDAEEQIAKLTALIARLDAELSTLIF